MTLAANNETLETTTPTETTEAAEAPKVTATIESIISVRITGKRGKIKVPFRDGTTAGDVVREAAEKVGVTLDLNAVSIIVNGEEASADTPLSASQPDQKVDAAPHARLG